MIDTKINTFFSKIFFIIISFKDIYEQHFEKFDYT